MNTRVDHDRDRRRNGRADSAWCQLCDGRLTAHTEHGLTYYTGPDGRTLCPAAIDPLWLGHEPEPPEHDQQAA